MNKSIKPLSLKQNILWNSIGCLIYLGCQWLITVLVVVLSDGYQNSGELAIAMAVGNIFAPIALYRIRTYQVSDVNNRFSTQNYVAFRLLTILCAVIFALLYCLITQINSTLLSLVMAYLLFKGDEAFSDVLYGVDQKGHRMDYIGISQAARGVLSLLLFSLGLVVSGDLLISIICMTLGCMLVTWLYDVPHARRFDRIKPSISRSEAIKLAGTCLPAVLALLFCSAVVSISRQYFAFEFGEYELGIYAAVATPAIIVQISASYLYSPAIGRISEIRNRKENKQLLAVLLKLSIAIFAVVLVLCIAITLFGGDVLTYIYGSTIAPYAYLLLPVCIATGLLAYFWFLSDVLIIFRKFNHLLISSICAFAACLILLVPIIDAWGMNGINFVLIGSYVVGLIVALFFIIKEVKNSNIKTTSEGHA